MNPLLTTGAFLFGFALGVASMNAHWRKIARTYQALAEHWRREHDKQKERAELAEARISSPR